MTTMAEKSVVGHILEIKADTNMILMSMGYVFSGKNFLMINVKGIFQMAEVLMTYISQFI